MLAAREAAHGLATFSFDKVRKEAHHECHDIDITHCFRSKPGPIETGQWTAYDDVNSTVFGRVDETFGAVNITMLPFHRNLAVTIRGMSNMPLASLGPLGRGIAVTAKKCKCYC
jgi:hypothetical protein